jgi:hypothetical protein
MLWFLSFIVVYLLTVFSFGAVTARQRREYFSKILVTEHGGVMPKPAWEFCTRIKFLGLPLVHICIGDRFDVLKKPVKAWIALGNVAFGGLFAFGGVAIAPLSIGGVSVGLLPIGGFTLGVVAIGGLAFGGWTAGAVAVGWQSMGACAVAWQAAAGTFALAHDFAGGTIAHALQVKKTKMHALEKMESRNASEFSAAFQRPQVRRVRVKCQNFQWIWKFFRPILPPGMFRFPQASDDNATASQVHERSCASTW